MQWERRKNRTTKRGNGFQEIHVKGLEFELGWKGFQTFLLGEKGALSIDCSSLSWNWSSTMVKIWYPIINNFANVGRPMLEIHGRQYTACFCFLGCDFLNVWMVFIPDKRLIAFIRFFRMFFSKRKNQDKMFILTVYSTGLGNGEWGLMRFNQMLFSFL